MPAEAGDPARTQGFEEVQRGVAATVNIAKGDLISFDANGYAKQAATTDSRDVGFGVALEAKNNTSGANGDLKVRVQVSGYAYVKAGGAIKPNKLVKINNATTVIAHSVPANATTPTAAEVNAARDYYGLAVGRYVAHENESKEATDAANTDVIIVRLEP